MISSQVDCLYSESNYRRKLCQSERPRIAECPLEVAVLGVQAVLYFTFVFQEVQGLQLFRGIHA